MNDPEELPKLRLAPKESPADLARRFEREQRALSQQREQTLGNSLAPYRVGSVPYQRYTSWPASNAARASPVTVSEL